MGLKSLVIEDCYTLYATCTYLIEREPLAKEVEEFKYWKFTGHFFYHSNRGSCKQSAQSVESTFTSSQYWGLPKIKGIIKEMTS